MATEARSGAENIAPNSTGGMSSADASVVDEARIKGNAFYAQKDYAKAVNAYNQGLKVDADNSVLLSNRSACFLALDKEVRALKDAERCVELRPDWIKGHWRMAQALLKLKKFDEAISAAVKAEEIDPANAEVQTLQKSIFAAHPNGKSMESEWLKRQAARKQQREQAAAVAARKASETQAKAQAQASVVRSGEEYQAALKELKVGDAIPYNQEVGNEFVERVLDILVDSFAGAESAPLRPVLYVLPGHKSADGDEMCAVAIEHAFETPDTVHQCTNFLRTYCSDMRAHCAVALIPKSSVAFPQVWNEAPQKSFPFKKQQQGIFIQFESSKVHRLWFLPLTASGGLPQMEEKLEITYQMALLPKLLA
jgi:tetratricopeptide (TPR) repeat protein